MMPLAFGDCAAWLHPGDGKHGIVLCGALNHETLPLYQSWHALAAMIADSGLPALRFDYSGTGDSLGDDREPHRVEAWLQSIRAAARFMRDEIGVETVSLVGIRLGATLAALAAAEIGIERLVLIAPVVSGRAYVREARARSKMLAGMWRLGEAEAGEIASDGFTITAETAADIAKIDLAALEKAPAREVLIVAERSHGPLEALAARFSANGCKVTRAGFDGFAAAMDSATLAQIPLAEWAVVVSFLSGSGPVEQRLPVVPRERAVLSTPAFCEERLIFGANNRLAGVLCRPSTGRASHTAIFLNTGGNAHIGWGRMSVEHARALAVRGIASLRIDIAGLGDAVLLEASPRAGLYARESIADVREAIDLLGTYALGNIALVGHCSGAWLALNSAHEDARVSGLFLVNLQRFIWTGKENLDELMAQTYRATDSYLQEIGSGAIWRRMLKGDVNWRRLPGIAATMLRRMAARMSARLAPLIAKLRGIETETRRIRRMLASLSRRGARTLLVYSDTDPGREELARHFGPGGARLQLPGIGIATIENADHDITSERARHLYLGMLLDFLDTGDAAHSSGDASIMHEAA